MISVVLPTYNERDNIGPLVEAILHHVPDPVEVLVVDDDSPDGTWRVVEEMGADNERVRLLRRIGRRGLTSALTEGLAAARGEVVAWMDCDFSMPPQKIPELVAALAQADVAIGTRYGPGAADARDSRLAVWASWVINRFAWLMLDRSITDYTTGFVAARREVLQAVTLRGDYGEYCIDFLYRARRNGYRVVEIPYRCLPREFGESKTGPNALTFARRGTKYIATVLRLRWKA